MKKMTITPPLKPAKVINKKEHGGAYLKPYFARSK
jgi:hypothetical protein